MKNAVTARLKVHQAKLRDVYRDVARIHEVHRGGIAAGKICELSVNGKNRLVVVRGTDGDGPEARGWIRVDEITRENLGLQFGNAYDFELVEAGWWQRLCWAWQASEPGSRIAAQLSIVSLFLGGIAFIATLPDLVLRLGQAFALLCEALF